MSDVTGRCLCGHVTWRYDGEVGPASYCHCEDCRRCTGSVFNIGVRLRRADFRITAGTPRAALSAATAAGSTTPACPTR